MQTDVLLGGGEEFGDFHLGKPYALPHGPEPDQGFAVVSPVKNDLGAHGMTSSCMGLLL
jgi:hypothetical protein